MIETYISYYSAAETTTLETSDHCKLEELHWRRPVETRPLQANSEWPRARGTNSQEVHCTFILGRFTPSSICGLVHSGFNYSRDSTTADLPRL